MKTLTKLSLVLFFAILLFACNKITSAEKAQTDVQQIENESKTAVFETKRAHIIQINYPVEESNSDGKICTTNILEDNVNVRNYPSLKAEVVDHLQKNTIVQIRGFSHERAIIDGFEGNWVNVFYQAGYNYKNHNYYYIGGWVFSKYVNTGDIEVAPIRFVEMSGANIKISYKIAGEEIFTNVQVARNGPYDFKGLNVTKDGDYYVIIWGPDENRNYHYSNIPGIYMLTADTHELKHITYFGSFEDGGHAWTSFLGGFDYLIQDSGTGHGVRGITAWSLRDMKRVFDGSYYGGYYVNDHTIGVVYGYDVDEEIKLYAKEYRENNPPPPYIEDGVKEGFFFQLLINCSIDLETGERKILGGEYILTE